MLTTPNSYFPEIEDIKRQLKLSEEHLFVEVVPRIDSRVDNCIQDVVNQVEDHGGRAVYGWMIWEYPGVMAEATFHCVWESPSGQIIDVNLKEDKERSIMFIPDPNLKYQGKRIPTVRVPILRHPLVYDYIAAVEDFHTAHDAHFGADFIGVSHPTGRIKSLYFTMQEVGIRLEDYLKSRPLKKT